MAYSLDEEDPNKQQGQGNTSDQPSPQAPPTTSSAPGGGPGASAGKAQTPQSSPGQPFQNLSAYLNANNPQIQQQTSTVAGNLNNQYGQVQSDINKGKTDFGAQVQGGYAHPDENIVNQAATDTTNFAKDPNNVKAFQNLYNDQYTGPTGFENTGTYGDLSGEVGKAKQNADLFGSNSGIQTYFQRQNPNATKGGNILDSVLMQGNPGAYKQVIDASKQFGNLNDYLSGAVTEANQGVAAAQQAANQTAQDTQNRFTGEGGVIPTFNQNVKNNVTNAQSEAEKRYQDAVNYLKNTGQNPEGVSPNVFSDLGFDNFAKYGVPGQINKIAGYKNESGASAPAFDFMKYLNTKLNPETQLNSANVSNTDDYARAAALQALTGQATSLNPQDAALAGTGNRDIVDYNSDAALTGLNDYLTQLSIAGYGNQPTPVTPPPTPPPLPVDPNTGQPILPTMPKFGPRPS